MPVVVIFVVAALLARRSGQWNATTTGSDDDSVSSSGDSDGCSDDDGDGDNRPENERRGWQSGQPMSPHAAVAKSRTQGHALKRKKKHLTTDREFTRNVDAFTPRMFVLLLVGTVVAYLVGLLVTALGAPSIFLKESYSVKACSPGDLAGAFQEGSAESAEDCYWAPELDGSTNRDELCLSADGPCRKAKWFAVLYFLQRYEHFFTLSATFKTAVADRRLDGPPKGRLHPIDSGATESETATRPLAGLQTSRRLGHPAAGRGGGSAASFSALTADAWAGVKTKAATAAKLFWSEECVEGRHVSCHSLSAEVVISKMAMNDDADASHIHTGGFRQAAENPPSLYAAEGVPFAALTSTNNSTNSDDNSVRHPAGWERALQPLESVNSTHVVACKKGRDHCDPLMLANYAQPATSHKAFFLSVAFHNSSELAFFDPEVNLEVIHKNPKYLVFESVIRLVFVCIVGATLLYVVRRLATWPAAIWDPFHFWLVFLLVAAIGFNDPLFILVILGYSSHLSHSIIILRTTFECTLFAFCVVAAEKLAHGAFSPLLTTPCLIATFIGNIWLPSTAHYIMETIVPGRLHSFPPSGILTILHRLVRNWLLLSLIILSGWLATLCFLSRKELRGMRFRYQTLYALNLMVAIILIILFPQGLRGTLPHSPIVFIARFALVNFYLVFFSICLIPAAEDRGFDSVERPSLPSTMRPTATSVDFGGSASKGWRAPWRSKHKGGLRRQQFEQRARDVRRGMHEALRATSSSEDEEGEGATLRDSFATPTAAENGTFSFRSRSSSPLAARIATAPASQPVDKRPTTLPLSQPPFGSAYIAGRESPPRKNTGKVVGDGTAEPV